MDNCVHLLYVSSLTKLLWRYSHSKSRRSDEERWCSECIQVGGPRSHRGVIGTWFDKNRDPHGPAGPTAFWKVAELADHNEDSDDEGPSIMPWDLSLSADLSH